jgi:hypothetical protein
VIPTQGRSRKVRPERDTVTTVSPPKPLSLEITGTEASSVRAELEEAINLAESVAREQGTCGVLVTRHDYGRFSVTISPEVPYGVTQESQDWAPRTNRKPVFYSDAFRTPQQGGLVAC